MKRFARYVLLSLIACTTAFSLDRALLESYTQIECVLTLTARRPESAAQASSKENYTFTHPHVPFANDTSLNWAGYASATSLSRPAAGSVSSVIGSWTVPTLSSATHPTYCAIWVGIDGYTNGTVEQIGTEHEWSGSNQFNYAWFEMYPQYPYIIVGFPVNPGDSISASVVYIGHSVFVLTILNNTRKVYTSIPTSYTTSTTAQRTSAEWIVEAPYSGGVLPLSHFGTVNLNNCVAVINGVTGPINYHAWANDALTMVTTTGAAKAAVSALSTNGESFNVTWKHE